MKFKVLIVIWAVLLCLASCGENPKENITTEILNDGTVSTYVDVSFYDNMGMLIKTDKIPSGSDIIAPPKCSLEDGCVFMGWDKTLKDIDKSTQFYPVYTDIRKKDNVVYSSSIYTTEDDFVSVNVQIGGMVLFACMELQVMFDETLLTLESISNVDADGVCNYDKQSKKIYFAMASSENITAGVDLFTLNFAVKSTDFQKSEIELIVNDIAKFDTSGQLVSADHSTINGNVYMN